MLPGTERAIARIAEQLPRLVAALGRTGGNRPGGGPGFPPCSEHLEWEVREDGDGTYSAVGRRAGSGRRGFTLSYSGFPDRAAAERFVLAQDDPDEGS